MLMLNWFSSALCRLGSLYVNTRISMVKVNLQGLTLEILHLYQSELYKFASCVQYYLRQMYPESELSLKNNKVEKNILKTDFNASECTLALVRLWSRDVPNVTINPGVTPMRRRDATSSMSICFEKTMNSKDRNVPIISMSRECKTHFFPISQLNRFLKNAAY